MNEYVAVVVTTAIVVGSGLIMGVVWMGTRAWQRVVGLQNQSRHGSEELVEEMKGLRKEFAQLRDTTTRYDLAFDTALQRLESRVSHMENKPTAQLKAGDEHVLKVKIGTE